MIRVYSGVCLKPNTDISVGDIMRDYEIKKKKKLICCYRRAMMLLGVITAIFVLLYFARELFADGFEELIEKILTLPAVFCFTSP